MAIIGRIVADATVLGPYKAQYFNVARTRKTSVLYLPPGAAEDDESTKALKLAVDPPLTTTTSTCR